MLWNRSHFHADFLFLNLLRKVLNLSCIKKHVPLHGILKNIVSMSIWIEFYFLEALGLLQTVKTNSDLHNKLSQANYLTEIFFFILLFLRYITDAKE